MAAAESENTVPDLNQSFVAGSVDTPAGRLPQVTSELVWPDRWGNIKARWGVGRMEYKIDPGLYALGTPDNNSLVFVSANYKMSFDLLRQALVGRSGWILVLDTQGINVWCAAGKGTFGTEELVRRIELSGLKKIVTHRKLILPQLGAPGVAAHKVKQISGFSVQYGPIRAEDLPAYLDAGFKTTEQMRIKTFSLKERAVLIPIELVEAMKAYLLLAAAFFYYQRYWRTIRVLGQCREFLFVRCFGFAFSSNWRCYFQSFVIAVPSGPGIFHQRFFDRYYCRSDSALSAQH